MVQAVRRGIPNALASSSSVPIDDRHGDPRGFVTAVADGPSGAAGNAQCARKLVERMESSKLGGLRKLPDFLSRHRLSADLLALLYLQAFDEHAEVCCFRPRTSMTAQRHHQRLL